MGALGGAVVVGSASGGPPQWWSWSAVAVVAAASTLAPGRMMVRWGAFRSGPGSRGARWLATAAFVVVIGFSVLVVVHPPVGRHVAARRRPRVRHWPGRPPVRHGGPRRSTGTGPPRSHTTGGPVSTYPGLVPDGYLTILAEGGIIGLVLLVAVGAAVVATFEGATCFRPAAVGLPSPPSPWPGSWTTTGCCPDWPWWVDAWPAWPRDFPLETGRFSRLGRRSHPGRRPHPGRCRPSPPATADWWLPGCGWRRSSCWWSSSCWSVRPGRREEPPRPRPRRSPPAILRHRPGSS